ncbi:MAG: hypothetical protein IKW28_11260 [Lachnospiraceae bacterium]|nr:hypothetical protein [Lachnospiraceae bacterium]
MEQKYSSDKVYNSILAAGLLVYLFANLSGAFDFYFDINDDLVIRDILSGRYTGTPDGHTNQLLYPLGAFLAFCYKIFPASPVYSIFLMTALSVSLWMIVYKSLNFFQDKRQRACITIFYYFLFAGTMMRELVLLQYTAVSGILCMAACFWMVTTTPTKEWKSFFSSNLPAGISYLLGFMLRPEMAALCLPLAAVSGLFCMAGEVKRERQETKERQPGFPQILFQKKYGKYFAFVAVLFLSMGGLLLWDSLAYSRKDWKDFRDFFDARTKVYDYTWYPSYEKAGDFYEEKGISYSDYQLIDNYNFGLSDEITTETLLTIADYNEKGRNSRGMAEKLKTTVKDLIRLPLSREEAPYNIYVLTAYGLCAVLAVVKKRKLEYAGKLGLLLAARCVCWSYLIWAERVVIRVSHPLYLLEFFILLSLLLKEMEGMTVKDRKNYGRIGILGIFLLLSLGSMFVSGKKLEQELAARENTLTNQRKLEAYMKEHPSSYYYIDIYSMVDFTDQMFGTTDNRMRNYDYPGGWICNSPLQEEAKNSFYVSLKEQQKEMKIPEDTGIDSLLLEEPFYFIAKEKRDVSFLTEFYRDKGIKTEVNRIEEVCPGENPYIVYKLKTIE